MPCCCDWPDRAPQGPSAPLSAMGSRPGTWVGSILSDSLLLSQAGHRKGRKVVLKGPVGFKHVTFSVLTFSAGGEAEGLGPYADPAWLCPQWGDGKQGGNEQPTLRAGLRAAAAGWRAFSAGIQPRCSGAIWRSPLQGSPASACTSSGRLPAPIFHCEKRRSGRDAVATWTGAPIPSQAQAALPFNRLLPIVMAEAVSSLCPGMRSCLLFSKHKHPHGADPVPAPRKLSIYWGKQTRKEMVTTSAISIAAIMIIYGVLVIF